jgi:hypothetical protein
MSPAKIIARVMWLWAVAIIGCQSIVGIEKREYDPPAPPKQHSAQCQKYCTDLMSVCTGDDAEYSTPDACLSTCDLLPPGDPTEPADGNNVECRQRQIALAQIGEHALNCPRAGPGGDGVCGGNCESYCYLFNAACSMQFMPLPNCLEACGVLRDLHSFNVVRDHGGDTLQCRLVHVSNASWKPIEHCGHARVVPVTDPCVNDQKSPPKCEDYCRIVTGICTGANAVYDADTPTDPNLSVEQCMSVCAALPQGLESDTASDTVGCRKYHSYNSVGNPAMHCSHAGPGGDGHCGTDNCTGYCSVLAKSCPTDYATTFAGDMNTCLAACRKVKGSAANSGYSTAAPNGDTLQCRLLHAVRAFKDPTQCPSAVGMGDCHP